ncbi:MAG TPA: 50S ribosomal protein L21e [Nanoarchaeota archaeon]|nr:50S ribosomal protein L21e [Nanoarchaeota archaeon]
MVQRMGGFRRKTRYKLKKQEGTKGKISISRYFKSFKEGDTVVLKPEPSVHAGMPYPRFQGKSGLVVGKQGECYKVMIKDGSMEKMIIVHPIHLLGAKD